MHVQFRRRRNCQAGESCKSGASEADQLHGLPTSRTRGRRLLRKSTVYFLVSVALSGLLMWWLLLRQDVRVLVGDLRDTRLSLLAAYALLALAGTAARAARYRVLIDLQGKVRMGGLVLVTLVRNLFVDLIPARLGSLSYIVVLTRRYGFSFETGASTYVVSFVFDLVALAVLMIGAVLSMGLGRTPFSGPWHLAVFCAAAAVLVLLVARFAAISDAVVRCLGRLLGLSGLGGRSASVFVMEKLSGVVRALRVIEERKVLGRVFLLSLAVRAFKYASLYVLVLAVLVARGMEMPAFGGVFMATVATELTTATPFHGVAGVGTWAAAWGFAGAHFINIDRVFAEGVGLLVHGITQVFEYILGIGALLVLAAPMLARRRRRCAGSAVS